MTHYFNKYNTKTQKSRSESGLNVLLGIVNGAGRGIWTPDRLGVNEMLYHWAIPAFIYVLRLVSSAYLRGRVVY